MILLYRGIGFISRVIEWQTFSDYSHAAWWCQNGTVIEAWHTKTEDRKLTLKNGVQRHDSPATIHKPGTVVDVFSVPGINEDAVEQFLIQQIGKDYDFAPVLRGFVFRVKRDNPDKWFCSELVHAACADAGVELQRAPSWKVSPGLLSFSPLLVPEGSLITGKNGDFNFKSSNPSDVSDLSAGGHPCR